MKKFLVMFAIAVALVACNNTGEGTDTSADSARIADSIQRVQDSLNAANADTTNVGDTTGVTGDTTAAQ